MTTTNADWIRHPGSYIKEEMEGQQYTCLTSQGGGQ